MKRSLNPRLIRWLLVTISMVGVMSATIEQNILPLLVVLFAVIFLAAVLISESQQASRDFLVRLGLAVLLAMAALGLFNYVVNPFGLYPPHFFEPIALTIRDYKMDLYKTYSPPPETVILGSSRSFTVDPTQIEALWNYSAYNASVTDGDMHDYLALLRYMAQVGKIPRLLIMNVGAETFSITDNRALEPNSRLWHYADNRNSLAELETDFERFSRLFSKEQFETSVRLLRVEASGRPAPYYTFDANGMGHFNVINLGANALADENLANSFWGMFFKQYHSDAYTFDGLQQILELAKQNHMLVIGYMPPYLPELHHFLLKQTDFTLIVNDVTQQLDRFEQDYPFHYVNFIDSDAFSDVNQMFYDTVHPSVQASALMMQQLYDQFHSYIESS